MPSLQLYEIKHDIFVSIKTSSYILGDEASHLGKARKRLFATLSSSNTGEITEALADFEKLLVSDKLKKQEQPVVSLAQTQKETLIKKDRIFEFLIL